MRTKRTPLQTYVVWGYEIPAASPREFLDWALVLVGPIAWLAVVWWLKDYDRRFMYAAFAWVPIWLILFHVRNWAVRKEVEEGLHDPLYGPHLMRMRQREFDQGGGRKALIRLYVFEFTLVAAIVCLKFAAGIDVLERLGISHKAVEPGPRIPQTKTIAQSR